MNFNIGRAGIRFVSSTVDCSLRSAYLCRAQSTVPRNWSLIILFEVGHRVIFNISVTIQHVETVFCRTNFSGFEVHLIFRKNNSVYEYLPSSSS